jgi:NAD+ kinase
MSTKLIGLVAHAKKKGAAVLVSALREEFAHYGVSLQIEHAAAALLGEGGGHTIPDLGRQCELIIVLGGDGTILSTVRALEQHLRPIFGINLGTLGFLTCLGPADYKMAVQCIVSGTYLLSPRALLAVELMNEDKVLERHLGLNDAVISRGALSRLIRLETRVNGGVLTEYNADGLIVATPTGSTAYSLSAGGPLLTPESNVFAITPICPHTLTNRSVIVSDQSVIEVRLRQQQDDIYLTVDGQHAIPMGGDDWVRIQRAENTLALAMLPHLPFFEIARRKLKWSGNSL